MAGAAFGACPLLRAYLFEKSVDPGAPVIRNDNRFEQSEAAVTERGRRHVARQGMIVSGLPFFDLGEFSWRVMARPS